MLFGLGFLLVLLQLRHDVLDHLGVRHQVVLDDALDLLALVGGERLRPARFAAASRSAKNTAAAAIASA